MFAVISDLLRRCKEPNGYGSLRCKSRSYIHAASTSNYESRDVSTPLDMTKTTFSWQFHCLAQRELELVREGPVRVVWHGIRLDHALGSFWINNEKRRTR